MNYSLALFSLASYPLHSVNPAVGNRRNKSRAEGPEEETELKCPHPDQWGPALCLPQQRTDCPSPSTASASVPALIITFVQVWVGGRKSFPKDSREQEEISRPSPEFSPGHLARLDINTESKAVWSPKFIRLEANRPDFRAAEYNQYSERDWTQSTWVGEVVQRLWPENGEGSGKQARRRTAEGCNCFSRTESKIPTSPSCRQAPQPSPPLKCQWKMPATIHFVILFYCSLLISESICKQYQK